MTYQVKVVEDSIAAGVRLITFSLVYPRYIHAEFMTHRVFSRNASSSRAIPVTKLSVSERVYPIRWGMNQSGMQASMEDLSPEAQALAKAKWDHAADVCQQTAKELAGLGLHKQWANRMLEWFGTISVVVTATEWDNFYELRDHPDAQPEIQHLARTMRQAASESIPRVLGEGEWHLPFVSAEERARLGAADAIKCSVARCARTSYLNHDGTNPNVEKDIALHDLLVVAKPAHASPAEHQATPAVNAGIWTGNFRGWSQYRKTLGL